MRRRRLLVLVAGLVCLLLCSMPQRTGAQPVQARVEKGIGEYQDLEFAAAITTLEAVLRLGTASQSQKLLALELIAISHLSLGHTKESRGAFARLLRLSPDYVLRNHDGSPKVESLFESVRAGMPKTPDTSVDPGDNDVTPKDTVTVLRQRAFKSARAGRRLDLAVESKGPEASELVFFWRTQRGSAFQALPLRKSRALWRGKLALPQSEASYSLEYYLLAKGLAGQTLATLGDSQDPLAIEVAGHDAGAATGAASPWYGRWPIWAGVGVAIAGGSILVLSSGSDPQQGALSPGRITLTP